MSKMKRRDIENLKDTYFGYVNSDIGMWCGIWGLMAIVFGVSLIVTHSPQDETLVPGIVSVVIGVFLVFCLIGWSIRYAFVAAKYHELFPRRKRKKTE